MSTQRDQWVREALRAQGADALIAWRPEELVLLTGYLSHWGLSVCLYPVDGAPTLYIPELEPPEGLPAGVTVKTFPWGIITEPDPWGKLFAMLRADVGKRKITLQRESSGSVPPSHPAEAPPFPTDFKDKLPSPALDATPMIAKLLSVKTTEEVRRVRLANQTAQHGLKAFFANLRAGRSEAEIAAAVEAAIQSRTGLDGVRYARAWAYVHGGPNTAFFGRFNRSSGRRLQEGELVCLELGTCVNGYWCDLTRTGAVGKPSAAHQKIMDAVREAQAAGIAAVRPGATGGEVDRAARAVIEARGFGRYFNHATGHPVGFRYHDPGPFLAPGSPTRLEAGMIVTVEPGVYGEELGGGCRFEDNVLVTDNGAEVLSRGED